LSKTMKKKIKEQVTTTNLTNTSDTENANFDFFFKKKRFEEESLEVDVE
ncbi:13779_t:CDS:1, partial [Racocetra fulgida]